ncbi:MAG: hypothetical protein ACLFQ6_12765, partial [Candidatus Sumerlaeia bacterium]
LTPLVLSHLSSGAPLALNRCFIVIIESALGALQPLTPLVLSHLSSGAPLALNIKNQSNGGTEIPCC